MPTSPDRNPPVPAPEPGQRRPYQRPRLVRFGHLAEITAMVGNMGGADGGVPPMHKTQL